MHILESRGVTRIAVWKPLIAKSLFDVCNKPSVYLLMIKYGITYLKTNHPQLIYARSNYTLCGWIFRQLLF